MKYLFSIVCLLTISIFSPMTLSADLAGRIIMARGDVQAINDAGDIRNLKRRDSIYSHEVIKTGTSSRVQIRFIDNALLALKENSELNIKSYVYNEANENDNQVLMELLTGGFRTLTGKIGKGNKEAYKVDTPVASIGIRGTLYDIQIAADKIFAGVWKGGIALKTQQGNFDLGMNASFDFAEISSTGDFTGLLTPPESLTPPSETQEDSADKKQTRKSNNTPKSPSQNRDSAISEGDTNTIPSPFEREEAPNQDEVQKDKNFTATETKPDDGLPDDNTDPDDTIDIPPPAEGYTPDIRLSPKEFTQLSDDPKVALILGLSNQNLGISLNKDGSGDQFFLVPTEQADGTAGNDIIRRGSAIEKDLSNIVPWSDQVSWGIWQGTSEAPIQRFTRFNNDQFFEPIANDLFYMAFSPATAAEIKNGLLDGNFSFSTSRMSLAGTGRTDYIANANNNGTITNVSAQFNLTSSSQAYSINNISLNVDVDMTGDQTADQAWNMSASTGQIDGSKITIDNLQGNLTNFQSEAQSQAKGSLSGFLLSPKTGTTVIDTFAGGFEISTIDGNESIGGVVILQSGQIIPQ